MNWNQEDIAYFNSLGISVEEIDRQLLLLRKGVRFPELVTFAGVQNGIRALTEEEKGYFLKRFEELKSAFDRGRFIPASGAATRMFTHLLEFLEEDIRNEETLQFIEQFENFAFSNLVTVSDNPKKWIADLLKKEPNFIGLPKALIPFHRNENNLYTALESQLAESAQYALGKDGCPQTHFTINENYSELFDAKMAGLHISGDKISHRIDFSFQQADTDTIAVDAKGEPVRRTDGKIMFRPGGHGALLKNLNELNYDIIYIRNIDNVVSPSANQEYVREHRIMGGMMMESLHHLFAIQKKVDEQREVSAAEIKYLKEFWNYPNGNDIQELRQFIFRPVRICGMVKNQGEPGGGPFWIKESDGTVSLQIIESSQVNKNDASQWEIFTKGTHFNPVDICCSIKNFKGEKYDLNKFCKKEFSFLSKKNQYGQEITVLEHPGLWNGSMHYWLTVFVEIPESIFNPVKTVNDLLRPAHQK